jgi:hypothetical protein
MHLKLFCPGSSGFHPACPGKLSVFSDKNRMNPDDDQTHTDEYETKPDDS